jgi:hypothetical protein
MPGRNGDTMAQRWLAVSQQLLEETMKSKPNQSRRLYGEAVVNWSKMPATQIPVTPGRRPCAAANSETSVMDAS